MPPVSAVPLPGEGQEGRILGESWGLALAGGALMLDGVF